MKHSLLTIAMLAAAWHMCNRFHQALAAGVPLWVLLTVTGLVAFTGYHFCRIVWVIVRPTPKGGRRRKTE